MVSFLTPKMCTFALLISLLFISISASGHQFEVGGERGWAPPLGNETETYNEWAEQNRFHIGDIIYFKYQDDTVLMVSQEDYESCNGSSPIEIFGGATFEFDRHGFFYFISENQENCEAGQRIIIRVMVQNEYHPSVHAPAPSPVEPPTTGGSPGGYDWRSGSGSVAFSSATMVVVTSYVITAMSGMLLILYLLMH
ncbi:LOW QUALITY PROTEIN: hypothetical protein V2J09_015197 [Rumex salicifolius]